jgi:hypothetical protein
LIEALTRVKDSFNSYPLGRPAQAGAIGALEDKTYFSGDTRSNHSELNFPDRLTDPAWIRGSAVKRELCLRPTRETFRPGDGVAREGNIRPAVLRPAGIRLRPDHHRL